MHDKSLVHDDLIASRQRIYAAPEMRRAMEYILSMHTPEARQRVARTNEQGASIKAPTLVLWNSTRVVRGSKPSLFNSVHKCYYYAFNVLNIFHGRLCQFPRLFR